MADHSVVDIRESQMSCGVMELSRIDDDTTRVLYAIGTRLYHPSRGNPCAIIVASDIVPSVGEETGTTRLMKKAEEYHFGQFGISGKTENPRTGNIIRLYWWIIDHQKFKEWYSTMRVAKLGRVGS